MIDCYYKSHPDGRCLLRLVGYCPLPECQLEKRKNFAAAANPKKTSTVSSKERRRITVHRTVSLGQELYGVKSITFHRDPNPIPNFPVACFIVFHGDDGSSISMKLWAWKGNDYPVVNPEIKG